MWLWILGIVSSLGLVGTIGAAIAFPSVVIPVLQAIVGRLLKCRTCLLMLAAIALLFTGALYGVHVEKARQAARIEKLRQAAAAAAVERDAEVRADLEKSFAPALDAQRALVKSLQQKVEDYAKRKPAPAPGKPATSCKLGDAAHLLRPPAAKGSAGAAKGGIADYLRRNFNGN